MLFYYTLWTIIVISNFSNSSTLQARVFFNVFIIFLTIMTGLRYAVGADWGNYLAMYDLFRNSSFFNSLTITDLGYGIFNYVSQLLNIKDTILVNFLCSVIFYISFYKFSLTFKNYWLPLLISFSYLILVVSMGYTRQSVAIALVLLAFSYVFQNKYKKFIFCVFLALLFHKSAIIIFSFIPLLYFNNILKKSFYFYSYAFLSFILLTGLLYLSTLSGDNIYTSKTSEISSAGALFRLAIHLLPLGFYFSYRNQFIHMFPNKYRLFDFMVLMILYALILAIPFSTLADRFNLYLIMFDIFVFSLLYPVLSISSKNIMLWSIVIINTLVIVIWLNFGSWSFAWLPYQNYITKFLQANI